MIVLSNFAFRYCLLLASSATQNMSFPSTQDCSVFDLLGGWTLEQVHGKWRETLIPSTRTCTLNAKSWLRYNDPNIYVVFNEYIYVNIVFYLSKTFRNSQFCLIYTPLFNCRFAVFPLSSPPRTCSLTSQSGERPCETNTHIPTLMTRLRSTRAFQRTLFTCCEQAWYLF